jgi:hypothetical protein
LQLPPFIGWWGRGKAILQSDAKGYLQQEMTRREALKEKVAKQQELRAAKRLAAQAAQAAPSPSPAPSER